ncbi:tyrosine-protein phosphatase [uncultured Ruthenibacterium sp.]|uniref:tyrosine-protein phosphatase n=1 Tax=uncultured Ruthenibacterium sp. TaxID=1905347 RepID=UPI00349E7312
MNASLLQGTRNTRDLGVLLPGGKPCRLLRSDHLAALTDADIRLLQDWGIGCILDLRRPDEQLRQPTPAALQNAVVPVPIDNTPLFTVRRMDPTFRLGELYLHMLHVQGPRFVRAVHLAADSLRRGQGVLFHCSAGKDRTGLLAALLLLCAGVPRAEVIGDYLRTKDMLAGAPELDVATIPPNTAPDFYKALLGCEAEAMERALDEWDKLGGAARWLENAGADPADIAFWSFQNT